MMPISLTILVIAAAIGVRTIDPPTAPDTPLSQPTQPPSSPDETVIRHRRGDPSKSLASIPQIFIAVPPQISAADLKYWRWIFGGITLDEHGVATALDSYRQRDDSLRSRTLPGVFEAAIAAASPPDEWGAEQRKNAAHSIERLRNRFLAEEAVVDRALFEDIARLSHGAINPEELVALRNSDVARLYPDMPAAASADVGRMVHSLCATAAISDDSAKIAALILRRALPAAADALHARATSDLIADGCLPELLQGLASRGDMAAAREIESAVARYRITLRNFAASAERLAGQNRTNIDDTAAGLAEADATIVRRRFETIAYGALADPPLDGHPMLTLIPRIPDAAARPGIEAIVRDWMASNELHQRDAQRAFDSYQFRRLASPSRDHGLWMRTASRIADLHAESRRAMLPIAAFIVAAMGADAGMVAKSQLDDLVSAGQHRSDQQVDSIDAYFSRTRIEPTREGIRVGNPLDIKAMQQNPQGVPAGGGQELPASMAPSAP